MDLEATSPTATGDDGATTRPRGRRLQALTLGLFLVFTVIHTWPLASAPGTWSRNDNADTVLGDFVLAWTAHQVVREPLQLFHAPIFYPERYTLAYSDHIFVPAIFGAPLLWGGVSPVLVFNLLLLLGFALTGWTMCLVVWRWTGSWTAGVVSGSLAAFNAMSLTRLPDLQDQHLEFLPLALLALDRLLQAPRVRHAVTLAGCFVLQALTSGYWLVFSALALGVGTLVRPRDWWGSRFKGLVPQAALAAGLAGAALLPFLLPYLIVRREQGLTRSLDEVAQFSAHWTDYLATGGRLHFAWWSQRFFAADALFPGMTALLLVAMAIGTEVATRDRRARMALGFGVAACALSFGPAFPLYGLLYRVFPVMVGLRGAARFGHLSLLAVAVLAGFGLAALQRRFPRKALALGVLVLAGVHIEALRAPVTYTKYQPLSPVWDELTHTDESAVLAFFPFYGPDAIFRNTRYMLASTHSFRRMLNGYSGFVPASYRRHVEALRTFPDRSSIDYLRGAGVTDVVIQGHLYDGAWLAGLDQFPELELTFTDGSLRFYHLRQ